MISGTSPLMAIALVRQGLATSSDDFSRLVQLQIAEQVLHRLEYRARLAPRVRSGAEIVGESCAKEVFNSRDR